MIAGDNALALLYSTALCATVRSKAAQYVKM